MSKTVLFQINHFSISTQFKYKHGLIVKTFLFQSIQISQTIQFSLIMPLVLLNPLIGLYQMLPRRARVDLGAMAMKGCSVFPKAPTLLKPHHQAVILIGRGLTPLQRCNHCILQPQPTWQWSGGEVPVRAPSMDQI